MKVIWSPLAVEQTRDIAFYIAQDKPSVAKQWAEDIFASVDRLTDFPKSGRIVPEIKKILFVKSSRETIGLSTKYTKLKSPFCWLKVTGKNYLAMKSLHSAEKYFCNSLFKRPFRYLAQQFHFIAMQ